MQRPLAPIALFVYKRPAHTRKTLDSLLRNPEFATSPFFVFSDGPRHAEDVAAVQEVRELIQGFGLPNLRLVQSETNQGLANSVIAGVTRLCAEFGSAIVIEDDLLLSPRFLAFMNESLETYRDAEKVMHVSGYMYPVEHPPKLPFFYRNASSWGWATWKRAWDHFEPDSERLLATFGTDPARKYEFDILGTAGYFKMLEMQSRGEVDSWSIRWDASLFLRGGLSLYPGPSLVQNIGMDGSGIHCEPNDFYTVELGTYEARKLPTEIREDLGVVQAMAKFHRSMKKPLFHRVMGRLKRWWD